VLGGLALVLASIGLYGVLSVGVAQRRRELGIRLAVGASPAAVGALILGEGLLLTGTGIVAGVGGAAVLVAFLRSIFVESSAVSLLPHLAGIGTVLLSSAAALALPARRAAAVDPIVALRSE
jgi:ABC-type antimicrobial peptide transport system permease subunit